MKKLSILLAAIVLIAMSTNALATLQDYYYQEDWAANVLGITIVNFNDLNVLAKYDTLIRGNVTFSVPDYLHNALTGLQAISAYSPMTGNMLAANNDMTTIQGVFTTSPTAVGAYIAMGQTNDLNNIGINIVTNIGSQSFTVDYSGSTFFFGVIGYNGENITSISFTPTIKNTNQNIVCIDDFSYGEGKTSVPEPATLLLLGLGLMGFAGTRKLRK